MAPRRRGKPMEKGRQGIQGGFGPLIIKIGGKPMQAKIEER